MNTVTAARFALTHIQKDIETRFQPSLRGENESGKNKI